MPEYKSISGEIWVLFKKYIENIPETDKGWDDLIGEFNSVASKYKGTNYERYAIEYCAVCTKEIERVWRRKKK